ncbi:MAG: DNA-deoxyinosine glycosylase [Firmicutes bacterium]|nr:DNA-deoxyinosine glycosylase [Bacillota bacterium]MDY5531793.1 DNA-deoxyinosine glycosylase [Pumilibacteraceae bacterium]
MALSLQKHNIPPLYDMGSTRLILGSFPSVKSRQTEFYYSHPQNRFWKVLAAIYSCPVPDTIERKKNLILSHNLALFDVIASCDISGSADSKITNVVPNDLSPILSGSKITKIYVNGKTAEKYYNKYLRTSTDIECVTLPSTSPANAACSLEKLIESWKIIAE